MTNAHTPQQTILVVDDAPENIDVLVGLLQAEYKVKAATTGEKALNVVTSKNPPDLILLDIMMPEMDGYVVCQQLKADARTQDIPVVFMSALEETLDKVKAFQAGGIDYITKPFQAEEVVARVRTHLSLRNMQRRLQEQNTHLQQEITERKRAEAELEQAYREIRALNEKLKFENLRMSAELDIARRLQQMILPSADELERITGLDIAGFMEPAEEVGGDYYDIFPYNNALNIGIGDVTGHGLESGVLMLMTHTAIRALLLSGEADPKRFLSILNRTIYDSVQRMRTDKTLTLALLKYQSGQVRVSGQHEEVIVVRQDGRVELVDTADLGFPIGLQREIAEFVDEMVVMLQSGDGVVLYSDGITEAENPQGEIYTLKRLCDRLSQHWRRPAQEIQQAVIADVCQHIGTQKVCDDLTLVILKRQ